MNKTEFLDELKNCLAVLEEKEQRDILEEYTCLLYTSPSPRD